MRKINYPATGTLELKAFYRRYRKAFNKSLFRDVNKELRLAPDFNGHKLTFEQLLTMPLGELMAVNSAFSSYLPTVKGKHGKVLSGPHPLTDLLDYGTHRYGIANFFMEEKGLGLKICYYCGIDYVNAFNDFGDYSSALQFLNYAPKRDLLRAYKVGSVKAEKIIKQRKQKKIANINDIKLPDDTKDWLKNLKDYKNIYNHFTLDHVMPKSKYKLFSLSLHNLVPCCFSCNSKFKGAEDLRINQHLLRVSPTSMDYSLTEDFKFRVFYSGRLQSITDTSHFTLQMNPLRNEEQFYRYTDLFKLEGRYIAHKDEILKLIEKKAKYPKTQVADMANVLKITPRAAEELIYGKELFLKDHPSPLHKCKRDIAENIRIIR